MSLMELTNMIYIARQLHSYLTHLQLAGIDEAYKLEWIGNDEQWYLAERNSLSDDEKLEADRTEESDRYDLNNCHTR